MSTHSVNKGSYSFFKRVTVSDIIHHMATEKLDWLFFRNVLIGKKTCGKLSYWTLLHALFGDVTEKYMNSTSQAWSTLPCSCGWCCTGKQEKLSNILVDGQLGSSWTGTRVAPVFSSGGTVLRVPTENQFRTVASLPYVMDVTAGPKSLLSHCRSHWLHPLLQESHLWKHLNDKTNRRSVATICMYR